MKIALVGYGKMGREIETVAKAKGHEITLIIDERNTDQLDAEHLSGIDVVIEFSTPQTACHNVVTCLRYGVPVVCGTTGWGDQLDEAKRYCQKMGGAFFYASNYSVGVNLFFRLNEQLARMMNRFPGYEVSMREVHHTQKKDAPSGTAITLAERIVAWLDRKSGWTNEPEAKTDRIAIVSERTGTVPGIHEVRYESAADIITVCHEAKSRKGFAEGAVLAAEFIQGKQGIFSMDDMLDIND